ncbi:MAG: hypothetical protein ABR987_18025, partial [Terracidiphilus sp.]
LLMGNMRSFWDFYRGLGLGATISLTAEGILFWQMSSLAKTDARRLRPILATFAIAYTAFAVNSFTYFFLAPVIVELIMALFLVLAIVTAKPEARAVI